MFGCVIDFQVIVYLVCVIDSIISPVLYPIQSGHVSSIDSALLRDRLSSHSIFGLRDRFNNLAGAVSHSVRTRQFN